VLRARRDAASPPVLPGMREVLSHPCRDEAATWMGHPGFWGIEILKSRSFAFHPNDEDLSLGAPVCSG